MKEYQQKERCKASKISRLELASGPDSFSCVLITVDTERIYTSREFCRAYWHLIEAGSYYVVDTDGYEQVISAELFESHWEPITGEVK